MQFINNTSVYTSAGQEVGQIDRVVIDPRSKEVTHVIIRKGFFFPQDKVVPIQMIASGEADRVLLRDGAGDLDLLPDYHESRYIVLDRDETPTYSADLAQPVYWYPYGPVGQTNIFAYAPSDTAAMELVDDAALPDDAVPLKAGAKVLSSDGAYVGDVERVLVSSSGGRDTTFVVSKGWLLKQEMFIPSSWVADIGEDEIRLAVGSRLLESQSRFVETLGSLEDRQGPRVE